MKNEKESSIRRRTFLVGAGGAMLCLALKGKCNASQAEFEGTLYPIGGNAGSALFRFAELAGGKSGSIVILPHSSSEPQESAEDLCNTFMALGVKDTKVLMPGEKRDLPDCSAVFMTGGDQSRMMRLMSESLVKQLQNFLMKKGNLVGGTSAGAAAVAPQMIAGGMEDGLPRSKSLMVTDGLALLPGYVVDTHVSARARHDRLMVALSMLPATRGIGLDEDTACEIRARKAIVHGKGVAHVYKRAENFSSRLAESSQARLASVENMIYSIYPAGESFEL